MYKGMEKGTDSQIGRRKQLECSEEKLRDKEMEMEMDGGRDGKRETIEREKSRYW